MKECIEVTVIEQLRTLEQIQELDVQIDTINRKKSELPVELKKLDQQLSLLQGDLDQKKKQLEEFQKSLKHNEAATQLNKDREERTNQKLTGVGNTKEYSAASTELAQLQKLNETLSKQKAELDQSVAAAQKSVDEIQAKVDEVQKERNSKAELVSTEESGLDKELSRLENDKSGIVPKVDRVILARYSRVRVQRSGIGIAPAQEGRCLGCNMMLPPQLFNEVRRFEEVSQCPNCQRVLFPKENTSNPE